MEALVKTEPGRGLTYRSDYPEPPLGPGEVLVEIMAAAICGTDIHLFDWDEVAKIFPLSLPRVLGHEAAGLVRSVSPDVSGIEVGDRVAVETHIPCNHCFACKTGNAHNCENIVLFGIDRDGAFSTLVSVPAAVLFPIPTKMTFEAGALLEPAGVAMHAIQRSEMRPGDTVAVIGCGPIGLMTAALALTAGASRVIAFDISETRLQAAQNLGAIAINPQKCDVKTEVAGLIRARGGVDVAIEATGASAVYGWFLDLVRREGTVVTVGHPGSPVAIDIAQNVNKRGLTLRGVFGRRMWSTWHALSALIDAGKFDLESFVTHRFALPDYERAFDVIHEDGIKVMLSPTR